MIKGTDIVVLLKNDPKTEFVIKKEFFGYPEVDEDVIAIITKVDTNFINFHPIDKYESLKFSDILKTAADINRIFKSEVGFIEVVPKTVLKDFVTGNEKTPDFSMQRSKIQEFVDLKS